MVVHGKPHIRKTAYGWAVALCDCENEEWIQKAFLFCAWMTEYQQTDLCFIEHLYYNKWFENFD